MLTVLQTLSLLKGQSRPSEGFEQWEILLNHLSHIFVNTVPVLIHYKNNFTFIFAVR